MKQVVITFLSLLFLVSCQEKTTDKKAILSESNGKINNVSIIIDENLWSGEIGDSIRKKLAAPVDGLPQEEPLFNLNQYPTKVFEGFARKSRNIVIIQKGKPMGFSQKNDLYARPQKVFVINGTNNDEVLNVLEKKSSEIIKEIKAGEIVENQRRMKKALIDDKNIRDRFGVSLEIGHGYQYDMVKDNFLWIRKEFSSGYNSILVYEVPFETIEKDDNIIGNIITMRDSIGKQNIHGVLPNTWMITEEAYAPYLFDTTIQGRKNF